MIWLTYTITAAYGIGIASVILNESIILLDVLVDPSSSVNRTLDITNIERPVSIALNIEANNSLDNAVVEQTVIDPKGFIVNKDEFGEDGQSDIFTNNALKTKSR